MTASEPSEHRVLRYEMVERQLVARDIHDARVLDAMRRVPRHRFAPEIPPEQSYRDRPHPIGHAQTISQPYIVALMSQLAALGENARVLEIGTGSGYQAAVLAEMGAEVFTIEIVPELAQRAGALLAELGYEKVHVRAADGFQGWPEAAPFDAIVVTAAAPRLPEPLLAQLAIGGRLVVPVDLADGDQQLEVHRKREEGLELLYRLPVRFVPMTGEIRAP